MYRKESDMFAPVSDWMELFLKTRYKGSQIKVYDTSQTVLRTFIRGQGFGSSFPESATYQMRVDMTAVIETAGRTALAFLQYKRGLISFADVGEMVGYSRIARPIWSCLLSPAGIGGVVRALLLTYGRADILEYHWERGAKPLTLILGTWNRTIGSLDPASVLPAGSV